MPNSLELNVSPALLHTFANHPFHVRKDMEMNELVDSIRESGVIVPLIVRSRPEGGYEIISGHRRCEACRELGIEKEYRAHCISMDDILEEAAGTDQQELLLRH